MNLGPSLRLSMSLCLRQTLEMRLEGYLFIKQKLEPSLELYAKRESELTRLYRIALNRGMVRLYNKHGMKFEYALVSVKDLPVDLRVSEQWAFSHCLFKSFEALFFGKKYALANGSWLLFVVYDMHPSMSKNYIEYAAVHERGEQVTLGDHNLASKLEFAIAKKENNLLKYITWLEKHCPAKFANVFSYQTHLELPDIDEFQETLEIFSSSEEATEIRRMIEDFEWPTIILKKLMVYKRKNEEAAKIITRTLRAAEAFVDKGGLSLKEIIVNIRKEITRQLSFVTEREVWDYISLPQIDDLWRELRINVDRKFLEMLNRKQKVNPDYLKELMAADIKDSLPREGVLSLSFGEVLKSL